MTAVNDAPAITLAAAPNSYILGSPAVVVDANLGLIDPDSTALSGATVSISGGFASGDVLGYANQLGITGSYNSGTGVLTLTGASSVANYRTALQSITFFNLNAAASTATRTISFTATDGALPSPVATRQIQLQAAATLVGKSLFYNNSFFDGNDAAAGEADDAAIATDKQALSPGGTATFANYSSYRHGINGLMIDIAGLPGTPVAADFIFKVGNNNSPGSWASRRHQRDYRSQWCGGRRLEPRDFGMARRRDQEPVVAGNCQRHAEHGTDSAGSLLLWKCRRRHRQFCS